MDGYASRFQHVLCHFVEPRFRTGREARSQLSNSLFVMLFVWRFVHGWNLGWRRLPRPRKRFGPIDIPATPLWTQLNHEHLDIVHLYLKFLYTEHRLNMTTFGCNCSQQWNGHCLLSYKIVLFHIGVRQNQSWSVSCCLARVQDFLTLSWEQAFPFELWTALDLLIRFCFFVVLPKELQTKQPWNKSIAYQRRELFGRG